MSPASPRQLSKAASRGQLIMQNPSGQQTTPFRVLTKLSTLRILEVVDLNKGSALTCVNPLGQRHPAFLSVALVKTTLRGCTYNRIASTRKEPGKWVFCPEPRLGVDQGRDST